MGSYALITGASRGLGRAFAFELAERGYNLILVSLPDEEIETVADECRFRGVECHIYEADLTCKESVLKLTEEVNANFRLAILINNAGTGGSRGFEDSTLNYVDTILQLNITALTILTHQLLPNLRRAERAYILNISSMASFTPTGYKTVYPASKDYIRHFSRGLNEELRSSSVLVSVALLGPMPTQKDIIRRIKAQGFVGRWLSITPEKVAQECVRKMLRRNSVIIVGWSNRLSSVLLQILPVGLRARLMTQAVKKELQ